MVDLFKGAYDYYDWMMPQKEPAAKRITPIRYLPYITPGATPVQLMQQQQARERHDGELDAQVQKLKAALEEKAAPLKKTILDHRLPQLPPRPRTGQRTA